MRRARKKITGWDRWMAAITFAEMGEAETAREMLRPEGRKETRKSARQRREQRSERPVLRA